MERDNRDYVEEQREFADDAPLQFALREVQTLLRRPGFWIGLAAAIAILVVTGPTGTLQRYDAPGRLAYWGTIALSTFLTGMFATIFAARLIRPRIGARIPAIALGTLFAAIPITLEVWLADLIFSGTPAITAPEIAAQFGLCLVIAASVATIYDLSARGRDDASGSVEKPDERPEPPFLKRLPKHLGRELISLQAQDHYLEVTTANGRELILMRLSDAEDELAAYPGIRIHRSWWVARAAVSGVETEGGRMSVRLASGTLAPVSRARRSAVRKWLAAPEQK